MLLQVVDSDEDVANPATKPVNEAAAAGPPPLGTMSQSTLPKKRANMFSKCVACLYYAQAKNLDDFMRTDETCSMCYSRFCWQAPTTDH